MTDAQHSVTLLTQSDCHLCEHAKGVLTRVAVDFRIEVEEINLTSARGQRLAAASGVLFAPGVLLDGKPFAFGRLSERKLRKVLTLAADARGSRSRSGEQSRPSKKMRDVDS